MSLESDQMHHEAEESSAKKPSSSAGKFDFKSLSRKAFYTNGRSAARKLDFEFEAAADEQPSTARVQLACEASLASLAAADGDTKTRKRSAKAARSMGLIGASPRSPTLTKLQRREMAAEAQFSLQGGSPFATPHYNGSSTSKGAKRSRGGGSDRGGLEDLEEGEEDEEGDLADAFAKRGKGREDAGNLGASGLLGSFYGPSSAGGNGN